MAVILKVSLLLCIVYPLFSIKLTSKLRIVTSATTIAQTATLNVTWYNSNPSNSDDWVGFWQIGSSPSTDKNFVEFSWQYTYGGQSFAPSTMNKSPSTTGTIAVVAPPQPGVYQLYYCLNNSYICPASVQIEVIQATIPKVKCSKGGKTLSTIEHILVIVSENHSFDSIYGSYCEAPTNSDPKCNEGPKCCEAAPTTVSGKTPYILTDAQNMAFDPDHSQKGEVCKQNGGKMDQFVGSACVNSSDDRNYAIADETSGKVYRELARKYAMADRCFQSAAGESSENNMYYITGQFIFLDSGAIPQNSELVGSRCYQDRFMSYYNPTVLDLLNQCGISWATYAEGYGINPSSSQCYPDYYDSSDFAAAYYPSLTANPEENWKDLQDFFIDVKQGKLPAYAYLKGIGTNSEHPAESTLSAGENITQFVVDAIMNSSLYRNNTLIVYIPDESGGYYDHIPPPPVSVIDGQPYGPRMPMVFVGDVVYRNYVSHVQMEPTSIVKFIEWNWFGGETGQLKTRDQIVANLGSLIDPEKAGIQVPIF